MRLQLVPVHKHECHTHTHTQSAAGVSFSITLFPVLTLVQEKCSPGSPPLEPALSRAAPEPPGASCPPGAPGFRAQAAHWEPRADRVSSLRR